MINNYSKVGILALFLVIILIHTDSVEPMMLFKAFYLAKEGKEKESTSWFIWKIILIAFLVLGGGLLAGLTLGLMSLDNTNLQILQSVGTPHQRELAHKILPIRKNGHLLLVTMMLANTLTNMSLPILIDSIFGGGLAAVVISTGLILVFGEVIPQSICSRHGLAIGGFFAKPVQVLIWILYPVSYPIAWLLDYLLGANHGVMYRRAELKELMAIHGASQGGDLSHDEVTIIRGALDLNSKTARDVMTPIRHAFMVDIETYLDAITLRDIYRAGHSRIPVYRKNRSNIIGLLLIKSLILLSPRESTPLTKVHIHPIPPVPQGVPLFDLLNTFQEGTSHMAVVVDNSGSETVPVGIITLEDVLEELIQEEIVDETDVYVDVVQKVKAIRSQAIATPVPTDAKLKNRVSKFSKARAHLSNLPIMRSHSLATPLKEPNSYENNNNRSPMAQSPTSI